MSRPKKAKIAIVGIGGMGSSHLHAISKIDNLELVAVCDTDTEKADRVAKEREILAFHDHKSLLKAKICDAILVATPHYDHTIIGAAALRAGYHVLVEKPISVHKADCQKLIRAHKDKKQVFAAMFNQRTDPSYIKLKELIETGELGEITRVNWIITTWFRTQSYYDSGGWRATWSGEGGGVLLNQCPHQLDLLTWLFGVPDTVRAHIAIGKYHDIEVEDEVTAFMTYPNGATGVFVTSTGEAPGTNRLEVTATRGKVVIEGDKGISFTRNEVPTDKHCATEPGAFKAPAVWHINIPVKGSGPQHAGILQNFADAITKGAKLIAPAAEGINSVELANAMLFSGLNDKTVKLPLSAPAYAKQLKGLIENSKPPIKKKTTKGAATDDFASSF